MKKPQKPVSLPRKLIIQREVVVQLKALQLPQAVGGKFDPITQSAPFCL